MRVINLLHEFLDRSVERHPDKIALRCGNEALTYRQLKARAATLAAYLRRNYLMRGGRVVIYMPNSPEAVVSLYATLMAGGVFSIINPAIKSGKLRYIIGQCKPTFVITDPLHLKTVAPLCDRALGQRTIVTGRAPQGLRKAEYAYLDSILAEEQALSALRQVDLDLAAIIYTSGSTGHPKGVTLTHRNMVTATNSITTYLGNHPGDVVLNVLPLSFDYGLYQLLMTIAFGGTLILKAGFGYPFQLVQDIASLGVTGLPCVPTMMSLLLNLDVPGDVDLSSVRYITNTGAALPPAFIPRLRAMFPKASIYSMYGLTECKRVAFLPPHLIDERPDSVGIPMPNTEVYVVDGDGHLRDRDATGELVVRGASVMQGYYNDPEATANVLRAGLYPWERVLHTGDIFRIDEAGFLYFQGRLDDLFKSRGELVAPKEIETVLHELEEVVAARVTPVPDEILGNAIQAEVVLRTGSSLTADDILCHCRAHLEEIFVPQQIEIVSSLPTSASGKISRSA